MKNNFIIGFHLVFILTILFFRGLRPTANNI